MLHGTDVFIQTGTKIRAMTGAVGVTFQAESDPKYVSLNGVQFYVQIDPREFVEKIAAALDVSMGFTVDDLTDEQREEIADEYIEDWGSFSDLPDGLADMLRDERDDEITSGDWSGEGVRETIIDEHRAELGGAIASAIDEALSDAASDIAEAVTNAVLY
jgi:hypothetical protein